MLRDDRASDELWDKLGPDELVEELVAEEDKLVKNELDKELVRKLLVDEVRLLILDVFVEKLLSETLLNEEKETADFKVFEASVDFPPPPQPAKNKKIGKIPNIVFIIMPLTAHLIDSF